MKRLVYIILILVFSALYASANIITIDGTNIDWDDIPMLTEPGVEPIVKMVVPQDGISLPDGAAFCLMSEGQQHESMLTSYPVICIDADKDNTTGTIPGYCPNFGYDYEILTWSLGTSYGASEDGRIREMCVSQSVFDVIPFTGGVWSWVSFNWGELMLPSTPDQDEWRWSENSYHPYNVAPYTYTDFANTHTAINAYSTHQALLPSETLALGQGMGNDTAFWASWTVELTIPTVYKVVMDVAANSLYAIDCYLVDVTSGNTLAIFNGAECGNHQGTMIIGSWDLSSIPAGKYMLKVKNRIAWADFSLTSIAFQPEQPQYITCTQAAELCTSTTPTTETYTIRGYVTQITQEYISNYNNITFWMADEVDGGQVLMAYRVQPVYTTDQAVQVGDYVEVVGSLLLYSTTPEVAQGGSYTILNASSAPAENQCGDNLYWEYNGGTLTIIGDGAMYDYEDSIPWEVYRENITAISLPNGITTIGANAFYRMTNLVKINWPSTLISIGVYAFYECSSLSSITIPIDLNSIGDYAFAGCPSLTSIRVNDKNTTYDSRNSCNAIIHTATNTLVVGCQNTVIPEDVLMIGYGAFADAPISTIEIPNTVTAIGGWAFSGCDQMTTIDLPDSLTHLGYAAFRFTSLSEVVIPDGVTQIAGETFNRCPSLTSVTIPSGVTSIGNYAFCYCNSLTSVTVEATTPPSLGGDVFTSKPTCYIPAGTLSAYQASDWAQYVGSFVEQGSTTTPASDFHDFEDASLNAEWQFIQSGQTNYWTIGTAAGSASTGSNALYITNNGSDYSYTISSSSTSWAYIPVTLETTDTISFSWKGVGESGCDYLSVYLFPADYLPTAGSISTPSGAVAVASSLRGQTEWQFCTATPAVSGNYNLCFMWRNDGSVGNTPIAVDNVTIGENISSNPSEGRCGDNLYWSIVDSTLTIIGSGSMYDYTLENTTPWFNDRSKIAYVSLPDGLTHIGAFAFCRLNMLKSIDIPNSVISIGSRLFDYCSSLNSIVVESGNNVYDSRNNCNAIIETSTNRLIAGCKNTIIPEGITMIGSHAFFGQSTLLSIILPTSITTIGNFSFEHCTSITSITIPVNVQEVGYAAFYGCTALSAIHVNATTPPTLRDNAFIETPSPICYIPCGTLAAYQASAWASQVGSFEEECSDSTMITYELNGGVTNDYGWMTKNDMFQACMADAGVTGLASLDELKAAGDASFTTICARLDVTRCQYILDNEKWDWLEAYVMGVQNAAEGEGATVLTEGVSSAAWRYALAAFFLETKRVEWPVSANFSHAGTVQAFMPAWQHGFSNPTNPTASFTLNAPYKEGYTFDGWYATADFSGTALTTIDASTTGTLYAKWLEGTVTTPSADKYYTFDDASLNAQWQFIQSGQTNYWTIGTAAGSASTGSNALYITNNGSSYAYTVTSASVSWAYIPVTLETNETISFKWKGTAESCCDYLAVYLMPVGSLPTAGSTNLPDGTITLTGNLNQQSEWQTFSTTINAGEYNLCFMWRNDGSVGNTSIAVDDVTIGENTSSTPAEGQCGDNLYWSYANGTLSITGSGAMYDFSDEDVPWKDFRGAITSVSLPYGLTTIGTYAFAHCRVLSSITLPTTLTIIGDYAFYDCDALINMVIPESVTTIGNNAFLYCDALSNVTLPSGITHVEDNAFASCPSLTTITIPYGVTTIGNYAFYDCDALTTVNMPNSLVTIGNYAFANCDVLSNITIPSSVTTIGNNAFYSCSVLTSIHVEATTPPAIGSNLFSSAPICYIPCGTLAAYQASDWASQVGSFIEENCEQNDTVYNYNVYICYGETYTWEVNGIAYSESGIYTYSDSWTGETTAILNLTVAPAPIIEADSVVITENELPYIWRGYSVAEAGNYVMTEQSIHGCDSILYELYLTVEASGTSGLTYNVTVPMGTSACYIAGDMNGWTFTEMTKVDNTHFTITIAGATTDMTYKYCSGPAWEYVEMDAYGSEISARTYSTNDVVESWANIYQPLPTTPASDYHNFEDVSLNAQWQFIQSGQTNYWTIGSAAGSASAGSNALYITNDGYNYSYTNNSVSVSWAYIPVELETSDTISFYWKGTAESSYDNMRVYLYPENSLPTAGSSTASNDAVQVTSTYLCGQSSWQYFTGTPGVAGRYNLCFMWKNDASSGSMPIAVDEIRISQMTVPALPENQCGENLYWAYNNGTLTISGSGAMYDSHELLSYRQQSWFPDAVTAVSLPRGLTHIGATAFADCSNLTSITIPSTVISIGAEAFAWSGLERITLPESVQDIAEMAFVKCGKMTNFVWRGTPSTLGNVYNHMFLGCNQLDTVIAPARMWECSSANADIHTYYGFPSHIRYVEVTSGELSSNAISYIATSYESLTTLDISAVSNASLPTQAFASWTALETLHLPVNLTVIPYQMVYGCTNLSTISIPNYVQEFGNEAFRECTKLHSIDFADGQNLLSIGQYAFYNCSTLVSVTVPEGVQTLGAYAFYNNASLVKIKLPSTLNVIGNYAFGNCQQLMKMNVAAYAPPTVSSNTFYAVPRTATVYVPESAINTYKSTYIWNEFFIESNVQDALDNIFTDSEDQVQKLLIHGQVFIIRNGKCYDLMGQEVETEK